MVLESTSIYMSIIIYFIVYCVGLLRGLMCLTIIQVMYMNFNDKNIHVQYNNIILYL